jgi:hypothetical protein
MKRRAEISGRIRQLGIDPGPEGDGLTHDRQVVDSRGPEQKVVRTQTVETFAALHGLVFAVGRLLVAVKLDKIYFYLICYLHLRIQTVKN